MKHLEDIGCVVFLIVVVVGFILFFVEWDCDDWVVGDIIDKYDNFWGNYVVLDFGEEVDTFIVDDTIYYKSEDQVKVKQCYDIYRLPYVNQYELP